MTLPSRSIHRSLATTLLVLIALVFAGASPAAAQASFTFRVRGFGHGLGMSQYGARGFAEAGFKYPFILRYYYGNAGTDPKTSVLTLPTEPSRDVNVDKAANYNTDSATYNAGYTRAVWTLRPGTAGAKLLLVAGAIARPIDDGWTTLTAAGSGITVTDPSGATATYPGTVVVSGVGAEPPLVQVKEPTGYYDYEYVRFRGELRLTASSGKLKLINRVSMRDYLYGVVPRESPASWHPEALKTQAVAARSYAYTSTTSRELYTTTLDQVYGGHSRGSDRIAGITPHEEPSTNAAVDATARQMVAYDGKPVRAYFFSTSGGHTENNESVWGGTPLPYIRGVPDPFEVASGAGRHTWAESTFAAVDVRTKLLGAGMPGALVPAEIADINVVARGVSGRPTRIQIVSSTGVNTYVEGSTNLDRFKRAFNWGDRWFVVNPKTYRIAGTDRYHTSVQASLQAFGPSSTTPAGVAVVVGGVAEADALAAAGLAGAAGGGPVLLTPAVALDSRIRAEIDRLDVNTVYVVGGTAVVGNAVEAALRTIPGVSKVTRLAGTDRYATAARVAGEIVRLKGQPSRAIVVNGESIVDGVVVSGFAYAKSLPVVLVRAASLPASSLEALRGVTESLVVGGTGVVDDTVMDRLPEPRRIADGVDRYNTAALLGDYVVTNEGFRWNRCYVASGTSLADALSIGPTSGTSLHPVLLAENYSFSASTEDRLLTKKSSLGAVWLVGGEGALSGWLQTRVEATLE